MDQWVYDEGTRFHPTSYCVFLVLTRYYARLLGDHGQARICRHCLSHTVHIFSGVLGSHPTIKDT
jgi:hypothetical protein